MSQRGGNLDDIRERIDAMDAEIHALLMRRGRLIAELQHAKGVGGPAGTSAMRPAREAQMMRALAARHEGDFPLAAAERIWREIIASFTQLQAPFRVMLSGGDAAALTEAGRFYFGITTPLAIGADSAEVLDAIATCEDVAGVIMGELDEADWWARLAAAPNHPARVVARLPFFFNTKSSAPWRRTAFVLSRAAFEPSGADRTLVIARGAGMLEKLPADGRIIATRVLAGETYTLIELDGHVPADLVPPHLVAIGGYAIADPTPRA